MSDFAALAAKAAEEKPVAVAADAEGADDDDDAPVPEEESTATFTPVVHLTEVEVKTHEEDEDVLFKRRGKLYTFGESLLNKGTGAKSWNERGTGDVKLLKHRETAHIRVLMRQDKTMKVISNHVLDPRIVMTPNSSSADRSWVWTAFDFAEGELLETTFAIRFADAEGAKEFETAFKAGQEEMKTTLAGLDSGVGAAEADAAAEAIASLGVKSEEAEADKKESGDAPAAETA
mmetsp:Transcript_105044/g.226587  ORF Transcript_105044/g.226587 Transcript_105044/m.226587 type:complete len:233 (-) Transcript_105044:72-770(-)